MKLKNSPLVSILIPVYNRENLIAESLESAIKQTYKNIEIIISDNQSTDKTWDILNQYANKDQRIKIYQNEVNVGPVLNWYNGLKKCNGDYVKILWSDDLISESFIQESLALFEEDAAFVMSGYTIFNHESKKELEVSFFQKKASFSKEEYLLDILIYNKHKFPVSPGNALFRTNDILKAFTVDIFNTQGLDFKRYGAGNDLWLFLAIINNYPKVIINQTSSAFYRYHSNSITVRKDNGLSIYYEWAMVHFANSASNHIKDLYKAKLYLSKIRKSNLNEIFNYSKGNLNVVSIINYLFRKVVIIVLRILK